MQNFFKIILNKFFFRDFCILKWIDKNFNSKKDFNELATEKKDWRLQTPEDLKKMQDKHEILDAMNESYKIKITT